MQKQTVNTQSKIKDNGIHANGVRSLTYGRKKNISVGVVTAKTSRETGEDSTSRVSVQFDAEVYRSVKQARQELDSESPSKMENITRMLNNIAAWWSVQPKEIQREVLGCFGSFRAPVARMILEEMAEADDAGEHRPEAPKSTRKVNRSKPGQ